MKIFEITRYKYDPHARSYFQTIGEDEGTPFSRITFYLQFTYFTLTFQVHIQEDGTLSAYSPEVGYVDDGYEADFNFDGPDDYEDFLAAIKEKSEEIVGRKLRWVLDDDDDDSNDSGDVLPIPSAIGPKTLELV